MYLMQYILPLVLSSFTGWIVLWVIIKLLFHPHLPITAAGFTIQGILPANKKKIAKIIGNLVSTQLFPFSILHEKINDSESFNKIKPIIETHIDIFLRERLKDTLPMISMLIGDKTINQLKIAFLIELETLFPILMDSYLHKLENDINIEKLITQKISELSIEKFEILFYKSANKQLLKMQALGAFIGLLIGLIQLFINSQLFSQ